MKASFYNSFIVVNNEIILYYNSLTNSHLLVSNSRHQMLINNINSIEKIPGLDITFYNVLKDNGFIVNKEIDERELVNFERAKKKFSNSAYSILLNPTMECNLDCWYCYEKHKKGSIMSRNIIDRIIKHICIKYKNEPFASLAIGFFGGEPMLRIKKVVLPIINFCSDFTKKNDIMFNLVITTNGTIINLALLDAINSIPTSFQITFDGEISSHDSIRNYKENNHGTYGQILKNLHLITEKLTNYKITIRINYSENTLEKVPKIIDDLLFLDSSKVVYHLIKIWQVPIEKINNDELYAAIAYIKEKGFKAYDINLEKKDFVCYADNYNQILINYDGYVFKCSARDFTTENRDGFIMEDGQIKWNIERLVKRLNLSLPKICSYCKLLPSCPGICSQSIIESNKPECVLEYRGISKEDIIIHNFNNQIKEYENQKNDQDINNLLSPPKSTLFAE